MASHSSDKDFVPTKALAPSCDMNVTPMIDVLLVLLIILEGDHFGEKKLIFIFPGATYFPVVSQTSQKNCHQRVYLADGDDFYFWICGKIFTRKKLRAL